ncbi:PREDICTED: uncharacterized protein LOC104780072 isoform X2 [Camelina sativa]|uniref:Uncharacterized protein LOC104780072 isoform X2 n=1 Tax=Camelina sativa TaxID=90675 RepID=A0ABM0YLH9_CAMSA|nr:PREDICTED: uncharacterized protein LOC104780072 isoform X2 [Camelina sativa]
MAGIDTQKQLLSLIRDFTSERSRGEQRVVGLKKRIEVLQSEVEASNSEVEHAKRIKEVAEEELNGYEVELSLNDTTIQSLEARIGLLQDEVSTIGSEIDALKVWATHCLFEFKSLCGLISSFDILEFLWGDLMVWGIKNKEGLLRDQFISQMEELNKEIREFQRTVESSLSNDDSTGVTATFEDGHGADSKAIKNMLSDVNSQLAKEEDGYLAEQKIQQQKELDEYEKKMSLMESIIEKTNSVQVLAEQISELEQILASLGEELQKRCRCQQCQAENLEVLSVLLQGDQDMEVS